MSSGKIYVKINTGEQLLELNKDYVSNECDYIITCLRQITRNIAIDRQTISKNLKNIKGRLINMPRILLVIDLQKEFRDQYGMYEKTINYCTKHYAEYDIVLPTLFCNNYAINVNFRDKLNWTGCDNVTSNSLAIYTKNSLNSNMACFEYKYGYASKQIFEVADKDKDVIDIVGCDSDACILATAFKLWDEGYSFRILTDYIYTTAKEYSNEDVIKILKRNFGKCVIAPTIKE